MSDVPITDPVPDFNVRQLAFLIGTAVGMVFLLYLIRYACHVIIIDVCILGDCTALRKLCCCCKFNQEEDDDPNNPNRPARRWRVRDVADLRSMGAFSNPVSFIYGNALSEEGRKAFLQLITDSEIFLKSNTHDASSKKEMIDKKVLRTAEDKMEDGSIASTVDNNACSICLLSLDEDETCSLKSCSHSFHKECIQNWIARSLSCPVCRKQMINNDKLLDYITSNKKMFMMSDANVSMER